MCGIWKLDSNSYCWTTVGPVSDRRSCTNALNLSNNLREINTPSSSPHYPYCCKKCCVKFLTSESPLWLVQYGARPWYGPAPGAWFLENLSFQRFCQFSYELASCWAQCYKLFTTGYASSELSTGFKNWRWYKQKSIKRWSSLIFLVAGANVPLEFICTMNAIQNISIMFHQNVLSGHALL